MLIFTSRRPLSSLSVVQFPLIPIPGWLVSVRLHSLDLSTIDAGMTSATHKVYASGGVDWDATLTCADLRHNSNKYVTTTTSRKPCCRLNVHCRRFYVLQLLHPVGNDSACVLFMRWGRVGERGLSQHTVRRPFVVAGAASHGDSLQGLLEPTFAISDFKRRFRYRTGTKWENRGSTVSVKPREIQRVQQRAPF